MATETSMTAKKNDEKVPKRIYKSRKEKMKREHLNELFLALANSLEVSDQSTGRASVLIEATRLVKDTLTQIKWLKEENAALLSESQYVTEEKNELKDDNCALETEIGRLRAELKSRLPETQLDLNVAPPENQNQELPSEGSDGPLLFPETPGLPQVHTVNPLLVPPLCSNVQACPEYGAEQVSSGHISVVSKPHARYPMPADAWPSELLQKQPKLGKGAPDVYRSDSYCARVWPQYRR